MALNLSKLALVASRYNRKADKLHTEERPTLSQEHVDLLEAARGGDWSGVGRIEVAFSGGKDSTAAVEWLLRHGCPRGKITLHHHHIDGGEDAPSMMDWPITAGYCRALAAHWGMPLLFSWREGGFVQSATRTDAPAARTWFQRLDGSVGVTGGKGERQTRTLPPTATKDLQSRYCSAELKIDVMAAALRGDERFSDGGVTLVVSGERREEGQEAGGGADPCSMASGRGAYAEAEYHKVCTGRRPVIQWRCVIDLRESEVWDLIREAGIQPHPCYVLGYPRCSCSFCLFGDADLFATGRALLPEQYQRMAEVEARRSEFFGREWTLMQGDVRVPGKREGTTRKARVPMRLHVLADKGSPLPEASDPALAVWAAQIRATTWTQPIHVGAAWALPAGAFRGGKGGPTA